MSSSSASSVGIGQNGKQDEFGVVPWSRHSQIYIIIGSYLCCIWMLTATLSLCWSSVLPDHKIVSPFVRVLFLLSHQKGIMVVNDWKSCLVILIKGSNL